MKCPEIYAALKCITSSNFATILQMMAFWGKRVKKMGNNRAGGY
jgi:hypothetical protein